MKIKTATQVASASRKPISTATQVAAAPPGVHKVAGAPGLYLKKGPSGGSWFFRYNVGKIGGVERRRNIGLGPIAHTSLADARRKANALTLQRASGAPIETKKEARQRAEAEARAETKKVTFAQAAEAYVADYGRDWKHRHAVANWLNPIKRYAYPEIGDMLLDEIRVADVRRVTNAARDVPGTARRLRQHIAMILDDAVEKGLLDEDTPNPAAADRHRSLRRRVVETRRYPRPSLDNAPAVFRQIRERAADDTLFATWVFMIATASRPSNALKAKWSEVDLDKKLWTVPGPKMKGKRGKTEDHVVPLSSIAIAVLERQTKVRGGEAIFPGPTGAAFSYDPFAKATTRAGIDAGSPHGWRSVFADTCREHLRIATDLKEAALAHKLKAVEGAYTRETLIEARRPVMESYANWLLDEGADVIAFPARA